ncbi:MAG: hypothetical protein IH964_02055 [Candidatus Dadabacteria bacterium]|nr:hypothetical protein [Candidatus Dadabacteria bacterium]
MNTKNKFPILDYEQILNTRDTIHSYARFIGAIRAKMTPQQKDYWHISLQTGPQGFRTTPIPNVDGNTFELSLNLLSHIAHISSSTGYEESIPLNGQSISELSSEILSVLESMNISPDIEIEKFKDNSYLEYNPDIASEIFRSYSLIDSIFKAFKGTITFETSPVQLWPHHMDIAFTCYTRSKGNMEQIAFGYLSGDAGIEEPYFYITVYPELENYGQINLIDGAYWHTDEWQGAVLKYNDLIKTDNPGTILMGYLQNTLDQILEKG